MLFGGAVPANGFMVQSANVDLFVNDNGPVSYDSTTGLGTGFLLFRAGTGDPSFITPPGYKPMGPVSVYCSGTTCLQRDVNQNCIQSINNTAYVAARAW
jgi:hypothetical protein